jgi:hypothetical protein
MITAEIYEMSPYATFAMAAAPATRELNTATLDYTVQFKTFGHSENDSGIHQEHMPAGRSSKKHPRHVASSDGMNIYRTNTFILNLKVGWVHPVAL